MSDFLLFDIAAKKITVEGNFGKPNPDGTEKTVTWYVYIATEDGEVNPGGGNEAYSVSKGEHLFISNTNQQKNLTLD